MNVNNAVNSMSGAMILAGLGLAHYNTQIDITQMSWLWLVAFVGANMFQMGFTGFCPAKFMFRAIGLKDPERNASTASSS